MFVTPSMSQTLHECITTQLTATNILVANNTAIAHRNIHAHVQVLIHLIICQMLCHNYNSYKIMITMIITMKHLEGAWHLLLLWHGYIVASTN